MSPDCYSVRSRLTELFAANPSSMPVSHRLEHRRNDSVVCLSSIPILSNNIMLRGQQERGVRGPFHQHQERTFDSTLVIVPPAAWALYILIHTGLLWRFQPRAQLNSQHPSPLYRMGGLRTYKNI
ncbi:hypothetical protein TNCV_4918461 [Trichonephila clavipes]|nr:hypothetical protein TNCV_4918461 [Trichonephila clavipes]